MSFISTSKLVYTIDITHSFLFSPTCFAVWIYFTIVQFVKPWYSKIMKCVVITVTMQKKERVKRITCCFISIYKIHWCEKYLEKNGRWREIGFSSYRKTVVPTWICLRIPSVVETRGGTQLTPMASSVVGNRLTYGTVVIRCRICLKTTICVVANPRDPYVPATVGQANLGCGVHHRVIVESDRKAHFQSRPETCDFSVNVLFRSRGKRLRASRVQRGWGRVFNFRYVRVLYTSRKKSRTQSGYGRRRTGYRSCRAVTRCNNIIW